MTALQTDWPFVLIGWSLMLGGVFLCCRALLFDRARNRRRCPRCWYAMDGAPGLQCPECGRTAPSEHALLRTRRRWRLAAAFLAAVFLGLGITRIPDYNRRGWYGAMPSSILILVAPADYQATAGLGGWQQFTVAPGIRGAPPGGAPPSNLPIVVGGAPAGPAQGWSGIGFGTPAPPPTRKTTDAREELWNRLQSGRLATWQSQYFLSRFFRNSPLDANIRVPGRWLAGEPIPAKARNPIRGLNTRVRVLGAKEWNQITDRIFSIGELATPRNDVPVEIQLHVGTPRSPHIAYTTTDRVSLDVRPDHASLLDRRDDDEANQIVRDCLRPRFEGASGRVHLKVSDTAAESGVDFLIAFRAAIELDGDILGRTAGELALIPVWKDWLDLPITWEPGGEARARAAPAGVNLVIRGDPEAAASIFIARPFSLDPVCWSGTIRVDGLQLPR